MPNLLCTSVLQDVPRQPSMEGLPAALLMQLSFCGR